MKTMRTAKEQFIMKDEWDRFWSNKSGIIISGFVEKVEEIQINCKHFFKMMLKVKTTQNSTHVIPVILYPNQKETYFEGEYLQREVVIYGDLRMRKTNDEEGRHTVIEVFPKRITPITTTADELDVNFVHLDGFLCRKKEIRKTPLTNKTILDLTIAINCNFDKSYYIPTIAWDQNAQYIDHFAIGTHMDILASLHSREYFKRIAPESEEGVWKIAYEVSIQEILE